MAPTEGARARQRVLADHAPRVQSRLGRIYRLVLAGTAARRVHEGDRHRLALEARGLGPISINVRITAVRKLAVEAADNGLLAPELAAGIARIKGVRSHGTRVGNWLSLRQAQALLNAPDVSTKKGLRDRAMFATLLGCGLRRHARRITVSVVDESMGPMTLRRTINVRMQAKVSGGRQCCSTSARPAKYDQFRTKKRNDGTRCELRRSYSNFGRYRS
jgi:integrase